MAFPRADRDHLRALAARVRAFADAPEMAVQRQAWIDHNALRPGPPKLLIFPEGAWSELLPDAMLACEHPLARGLERQLRQIVMQRTMFPDDNVVEPEVVVAIRHHDSGFGVHVPFEQGDRRGSYRWDPPFADLSEGLETVRPRQLVVDWEGTRQDVEAAEEAVGDLLKIRLEGQGWWSMGMTWRLIDLIGLEQMMFAMIDEPENVHAWMAWLRDEHLAYLDQWEAAGLSTANTGGHYVGSGGVGYSDELAPPGGAVPLAGRWGFAESQETVGISPAMFEEFVLPYQIPILARFGLNCYGCCEPLHLRWSGVRQIPNLRRVSVSPWADVPAMAEALGGDYVFSRKPNPAPVSVGFDEASIRADLRSTLEAAGDCVLEIILKDTHTVQGDGSRFGRWLAIAREEVERATGSASALGPGSASLR